MSDQYLTARELSELLRVSLITIRRLTAAGELPVTRIGRRTIYNSIEIQKYLQSRSRTAEDVVSV